MTRELAALRERMNRLFDESLAAGDDQAGWIPPADMYRTGERLVIALELPGVDEYVVILDGGTLWVRGCRPAALLRGRAALQLERSYGPFERAFALPPDARARERVVRMEEGVLRIEIPIG